LVALRELGPPDLVHLVKQATRNQGKQVWTSVQLLCEDSAGPLTAIYQTGIYHHVTGVDASSSASLAAYINTLTYKEHGPNSTTKIVEGVYWYVVRL
jgi:murein endopeptidase